MLDISHLPNDFCIGKYFSRDRYSDDDFPYEPYTGFVLDIKAGHEASIQEAVELLADCLAGFDTVAVVPSYYSGQAASAGIRQVATRLARQTKTVDVTACLRRHKTIQKRTDEGSDRSESEHLRSIELHDASLIEGKRVLLLDDVRSTGNSLSACQQILNRASPKSVHPLAFAQSIGPSGCEPEENYQHVDIDIQYECQQQVEAYHTFAAGDEETATSHLDRIEDIEVSADAARHSLSRLKSFAGFGGDS